MRRTGVRPKFAERYDMRINLPIIAGISLCVSAFSAELPICEEFAGEENISCVAGDSLAVITSRSPEGRTYEFYSGDRKAYLELSADGAILASSGVRALELPGIPTDSTERYISEVLDAILDDIAWK